MDDCLAQTCGGWAAAPATPVTGQPGPHERLIDPEPRCDTVARHRRGRLDLGRSYFVTGGAGFVGASVVRALIRRDDRVAILDTGQAAGFANVRASAGGSPVALDASALDWFRANWRS